MTSDKSNSRMFTRRRIIAGGAILVGGTLAGAIPAAMAGGPVPGDHYPAAPKVSLDSPGPGRPDLGSVIGTIVAREDATLYVTTDFGDRVLHTGSAEFIWKGGPSSVDDLVPGDHVYAYGLPMPDGAVAATMVEANLRQVRGTLVHKTSDTWTVEGEAGHHGESATTLVRFDASHPPEVFMDGNASRIPTDLPVGAGVWVFGVAQDDSAVRATKVMLSTH